MRRGFRDTLYIHSTICQLLLKYIEKKSIREYLKENLLIYKKSLTMKRELIPHVEYIE